jgi:integrase
VIEDITYDVRIYKTEVYSGARLTTYYVRWKTGRKMWRQPYRNKAQAQSFLAELRAAARKGEAFSISTGRPVFWRRTKGDMSWYEFACAYADLKWKAGSAHHRKDIARVLVAATPAMFTTDRGRPEAVDIRRALTRWGFNTKRRKDCPEDVVQVLTWVARNTKPVSVLSDPTILRALLDSATTRLDGKRVAPSTARRHRAILHNALEYAVERKLLGENPLPGLKWKTPRTTNEVDRRCVVNPTQAKALLDAVRRQRPSGPRLVAFFAVMYYCGLRPEEAVNLREENVTVPPRVWNPKTKAWEEPEEDKDWGELHFRLVAPEVPRDWTDDGSQREQRHQLKHRAEGEERRVPCPPAATRLLRAHIEEFDYGEGGRLFRGIRTDELAPATMRRTWKRARKEALSAKDYASPLGRRPYDLRHACLSTWLNGGVQPTQVAEWAGHSLDVLLRIYAKCLVGQDEVAKRRIAEALRS